MQMKRLELLWFYLEGRHISQLCYICFIFPRGRHTLPPRGVNISFETKCFQIGQSGIWTHGCGNIVLFQVKCLKPDSAICPYIIYFPVRGLIFILTVLVIIWGGFEPPTYTLSTYHSTDWVTRFILFLIFKLYSY